MKLLLLILFFFALCFAAYPQTRSGGVETLGPERNTRLFNPAKLPSARAWYEADRIADFSSGSPLSTWVDASARGNNATRSGSSRPVMLTVGGLPTVTFDGTDDYMNIPSGLSQSNQATTFFAVVYPTVLYKLTGIDPYIELSPFRATLLSYFGQWIYQDGAGGNGPATALPVTPNYVGPDSISPSVLMLQQTASSTLIRANGVDYTGDAIASHTATGGFIGFSNGVFYFKGSLYVVGVFENMPDANREAVYNHLMNKYRYTYSSTENLIIAVGDSLTNGLGSTAQQNAYPSRLVDLLRTGGKDYQLYNDGMNGQGIGHVAARFAAYVTPKYSASRSKNVVIILAPINDMLAATTGTGAVTYATLASAISTLKATGFTVYVATCPPSTDITGQRETERVIYNNAIRGNAAGADAVVNLDAVVDLQDPSNTTYYLDGRHMTDAGYALVAQKIHDAGGF